MSEQRDSVILQRERKGAEMRAETFLDRLLKIRMMIENKQTEIEQNMTTATGSTAGYGTERVQTSPSSGKVENAVIDSVCIEQEIEELKAERQTKIKTLERLPAKYYDILYKMYVRGMEHSEIAAANGKSYSWATTNHGVAVNKLQEILDAGKE